MIVALVVACAFFMETFTGTVITTALPAMAESFGTNAVELSLGVTAYMLSLAVFIPLSGWVADRYGGRTVFRAAIGVFTIASVFCGLSDGLWELVAARIVQGIGGAMMVPVGRLVMLRGVPRSEYVRTQAWLTVPAFVGPVVGPPVGGFITTYFSWRWVFFLNVPIGLVGIVLVTLLIEDRREPAPPPLDWLGFLLSGVSLASLLYAIDLAGRGGSAGGLGFAVLAGGGLALGALGVVHSLRHPAPLIALSLFRGPEFRIGVSGGALFRTAAGATPYLLPVMLQLGLGMTAFASGMLIFADAIGNFLGNAVAPAVLRRWGFRRTLIWNCALSAAAIGAPALVGETTPALLIGIAFLIYGLIRSMQYNALTNLQYSGIDGREMSAATSFASMVQQLCSGTGIALGALIIQLSLTWRGVGPDAFVTGDARAAFVAVALLSLGGIPLFWRLKPDAGAEVSGHRAPPP